MAIVDHVLRTERLVLRPVTADDHAALLAHWDAPDVRRFLFDGAMLSAAEITEAIEDSTRDFGRAGYGLWLVYEKDSTGLIGTAGLRPLDHLGLEIFYSLAPGSWGKGYATEAARAVLDHALGPLGLPEVLAEVDESNTASIAVIERLGMTEFDVVPGLLGAMARYRKTPLAYRRVVSFRTICAPWRASAELPEPTQNAAARVLPAVPVAQPHIADRHRCGRLAGPGARRLPAAGEFCSAEVMPAVMPIIARVSRRRCKNSPCASGAGGRDRSSSGSADNAERAARPPRYPRRTCSGAAR